MLTAKDIRDKEFSTQATDGYNLDEVDDFLDEIAEEFNAHALETATLRERIAALEASLQAAEEEKKSLSARIPDYDAEGYFNNVKSVMQASLSEAQRVADDTVAKAKAQAQALLDKAGADAEKSAADADAYAKSTTEAADAKVAELNGEIERLRKLAGDYAGSFRSMIESQLAALREGEALLK